jgi:hypothetical protein
MLAVVTDPRLNLLFCYGPVSCQQRRSAVSGQKAYGDLELEGCFVLCHAPLKFVQLLGQFIAMGSSQQQSNIELLSFTPLITLSTRLAYCLLSTLLKFFGVSQHDPSSLGRPPEDR